MGAALAAKQGLGHALGPRGAPGCCRRENRVALVMVWGQMAGTHGLGH